jgi:hypothetical protein
MTGKNYRAGEVVPDSFRALNEMVKAGDIEEIIELKQSIVEPVIEESQPEKAEPKARGVRGGKK